MTDELDVSGNAKGSETAGLLGSDTLRTDEDGELRVSETVEMASIDTSSSFAMLDDASHQM